MSDTNTWVRLFNYLWYVFTGDVWSPSMRAMGAAPSLDWVWSGLDSDLRKVTSPESEIINRTAAIERINRLIAECPTGPQYCDGCRRLISKRDSHIDAIARLVIA